MTNAIDEMFADDPEWPAAVARARAKQDRLAQRACSEGCCVEFYDPETGEVDGGWGPVGCACQST